MTFDRKGALLGVVLLLAFVVLAGAAMSLKTLKVTVKTPTAESQAK